MAMTGKEGVQGAKPPKKRQRKDWLRKGIQEKERESKGKIVIDYHVEVRPSGWAWKLHFGTYRNYIEAQVACDFATFMRVLFEERSVAGGYHFGERSCILFQEFESSHEPLLPLYKWIHPKCLKNSNNHDESAPRRVGSGQRKTFGEAPPELHLFKEKARERIEEVNKVFKSRFSEEFLPANAAGAPSGAAITHKGAPIQAPAASCDEAPSFSAEVVAGGSPSDLRPSTRGVESHAPNITASPVTLVFSEGIRFLEEHFPAPQRLKLWELLNLVGKEVLEDIILCYNVGLQAPSSQRSGLEPPEVAVRVEGCLLGSAIEGHPPSSSYGAPLTRSPHPNISNAETQHQAFNDAPSSTAVEGSEFLADVFEEPMKDCPTDPLDYADIHESVPAEEEPPAENATTGDSQSPYHGAHSAPDDLIPGTEHRKKGCDNACSPVDASSDVRAVQTFTEPIKDFPTDPRDWPVINTFDPECTWWVASPPPPLW